MTNLTYYAFDSQMIYTQPIEVDPYGPMPNNAAPIAPPTTTGGEVAQWQGIHWVIFDERPAPPPPPPPPPPTPPPPPPPIAKIDFLRLFTQQERILIDEAAATNPVVKDYRYMLDAATSVNLSHPDILTGVPLLEDAGLIGPGRAYEILAGMPPPVG